MRLFVISFLVTAALSPLVIVLAHRLGWVAWPRKDRWHQRPTALMGGIALFVGAMAAWILNGAWAVVAPLAVPATWLFLVGLVDDRVRLRVYLKLIAQILAAAVAITSGIHFEAFSPALALPLTFLWLVGITNALNLLDNMDGLAAGVGGISALCMAGYAAQEGVADVAAASLGVAGACAGFLLYNFNPARIFMGDCGSMFLGFSLAALAIQGTARTAPNLALSLLVPVAILAIPIFDTTLVSVARALHGRPLSLGGCDHSSHRLVTLGLSERGTVLLLWGLSILFGGVALLAARLSLLMLTSLTLVLLTVILSLGIYLGLLRIYPQGVQVPPHVRVLGGRLLYKKQLLQVLFDILLIPAAFVGAHCLRFEGVLPRETEQAVLNGLPVVLAVRLVAMAMCRAYRGMWRYAGMADALRAVAGATVGSFLMAGMLGAMTHFQGLSRAALVMDWVLFTMLAVAARTGYVALRQIFAALGAPRGPSVLILGAGPETATLIEALRDPLSPQRAHVLGILDDDSGKHGRTLNGVPVLGPLSRLPTLLRQRDVASCILGVSPHSGEGARILEFCRSQECPVHTYGEGLVVAPLEPAMRG